MSVSPHDRTRRQLLKLASASLALLVTPTGGAWGKSQGLIAVRVWPSSDYTRITLESNSKVSFKHFVIKNPERLVVDLEGVDLDKVLNSLSEKVLTSDPLIQRIRAGNNRPGVVRVVVELKQSIKPQVFTLKPIADYGHRLVVDLYPTEADDPLLALIAQPSPIAGGGKAAITQPHKAKGSPAAVARSKKPRVKRLFTVVLDAGHGGEDPGAVGRGGSYEKNVTLSIARRLEKKINATPGMRAVMTRKGDYFVPLRRRVAIARRAQGDLFVSIHADAFVRPEAHGSSVYILSERGASSSAAKWLAQKENRSDLIGGVNLASQDGHLARTLLDLSQTATINDSLKLGNAVLKKLSSINRLHKAHVEQAAFAVLRAPDIPSILVETAFISNPQEERRLNDQKYQNKMANAILQGISGYFASNPPLHRTTIAQLEG